jgi:hypothetical protein
MAQTIGSWFVPAPSTRWTILSYDLLVQDLPDGITSVREIPDDFQPRGLGLTRTDLIEAIATAWREVNSSDPAWLTVDTADYSIEFNLGADDPIDNFALHVRGGAPTFGAVARFLDALSVQAIDVQDETGLFDAQRAIQSFSDWADYRDSVTDDPFA